MPEPSWTDRALATARLERNPAPRPPSATRTTLAALAALAGSLAADALLVAVGTRLFPSTEGYAHFRFSDYGELTVIGVLAASVAWPVTTRITSAPRWLFLRMAVLVTVLLWIPDVWILAEGQPPRAVAVLMVMHLAIALVTYNLLVHLAPVRAPRKAPDPDGEATSPPGPPRRADRGLSPDAVRRLGIAMEGLVGVELALGIGALVVVPYGRPATWVPAQGQSLYLAHAALGGTLGLGATALLLRSRRAPRITRLGSILGFAGVLTAAGGGLASVDHPTRLLGIALMLAGTAVAGFGYLMLVIQVTSEEPPADPS
jgi:hypothetical protein